ncbi:effector-associated constant component EACC1 [Actinomadura luteofluorescens]|uniref:effector-associated constant component EACC1 n=1 Tax=Actinomadura luteofluorescens TaxID=46163 RepID=UPI003D929042
MARTLLVEIFDHDADPVRLDQLSRNLLRDLRRLGLRTDRRPVEAPAGAKAASAVAISTLVVGLAGTAAFKAFVNGVFEWLGPRRGGLKISCGDRSVELSAATPGERRELLEWLLACDGEAGDRSLDGRGD